MTMSMPFRRAGGLTALFAAALIWIISLASYEPADPVWFFSTGAHATPASVIKEAAGKMEAIVAAYKFTDPKIEQAAKHFVERYRTSKANSLGHTIGMEVHDVRLPTLTLEPGELFTIEPAMQIPDERLSIRLEDVILITETGNEKLSAYPLDERLLGS